MKVLGWIIAGVAVLLIAVGVYVAMNSGALLERAIERYGTEYLGAPVAVSGVDVSFAEGSASINGLVVGNPQGFEGPPAFRLDRVDVVLDTGQISSDLVVLEAVSVDGAQVAALMRGRTLNLQEIMDHLNAQIGANQRAEETGVESEVKLIIDRFDFTGARASAESDLLGDAAIDIPDVHLTDIGRESNGATVGEVLAQVLAPIYRAVSREMVARGVDLEGAREQAEGRVREEVEERLGGGLRSLTDELRGEQ